jgi:hypothetical protein
MEEVKKVGRIYKITSPNTDKIYIGSTTKSLNRGLTHHMTDYKLYTNGTLKTHIASFDIIKCGNINIELIEELSGTKNELQKRGRHFIELNKDIAINKKIPTRTTVEYYNDHKEIAEKTNREYYNKNKENLNEKIKCECGGEYTRQHKARHQKSNKHLQNITINITAPIDNHDGGIININ